VVGTVASQEWARGAGIADSLAWVREAGTAASQEWARGAGIADSLEWANEPGITTWEEWVNVTGTAVSAAWARETGTADSLAWAREAGTVALQEWEKDQKRKLLTPGKKLTGLKVLNLLTTSHLDQKDISDIECSVLEFERLVEKPIRDAMAPSAFVAMLS